MMYKANYALRRKTVNHGIWQSIYPISRQTNQLGKIYNYSLFLRSKTFHPQQAREDP